MFQKYKKFSHCNSHYSLTNLSSALGTLTSLTQLHISKNKLTSLPDELGALSQLQILKANNNRYMMELALLF